MANTLGFQLALASLPKLQLFAAPPPDVLALVKSILEEFYTDGIDQIVSAQLDDKGDIVGEFIDQVGARQVKRYQYQIADDDVAFKLLNPNEVQNFSFESFKPLFGKGSQAGQKKNCRNSTPCGDSCIESSKTCRKKPGSAVKAKIQKAKKGVGKSATAPKPQGTVAALDERSASIRAIAGNAAVDAAEAQMKKLFEGADLYIRCSPETIDKILDSGRLKSQFETMSSGGTLDTATRAKVERSTMGYAASTPPESRPIYGYFADAGKHSDTAAEYYGSVVIRLSPETRKRATFTAEDSLASELLASSTISPKIGAIKTKAFDMESFEMQPISKEAIAETINKVGTANSMTELRAAMGTLTYTEAQIHGQVKIEDIAEIIYTDGSSPSEFAKSKGLKISVR